MMTIRRGNERGGANHGWLQTQHSFSFADYFDPQHMGFRNLRVLNEDRVLPGQGFGTHGHRDMEILSYVLEGTLAHRDSMGHEGRLQPGDVQRMSAGTGIRHSEFNGSKTEPVHFLQIWLLPDAEGHAPSYEDRSFPRADREGKLRLVASPDGSQDSTRIHADARVYATLLDGAQTAELALAEGRAAYVQVARGSVQVNGKALQAGDGAAITDESKVSLREAQGAEVLVFDLA